MSDSYYTVWIAEINAELTRAIIGEYDKEGSSSPLKAIRIMEQVFEKLGISQPEVR